MNQLLFADDTALVVEFEKGLQKVTEFGSMWIMDAREMQRKWVGVSR